MAIKLTEARLRQIIREELEEMVGKLMAPEMSQAEVEALGLGALYGADEAVIDEELAALGLDDETAGAAKRALMGVQAWDGVPGQY